MFQNQGKKWSYIILFENNYIWEKILHIALLTSLHSLSTDETSFIVSQMAVISNLTSNKTFCFCRFGNYLCFGKYIARQKVQSTEKTSVINQLPHAYKTYNEFTLCSCWGFHVVINMWHWIYIDSMMKWLLFMIENFWEQVLYLRISIIAEVDEKSSWGAFPSIKVLV